MTVEEIIRELDLQPHPEGGYFRETYRSARQIPSEALPGYPGARAEATAIYFLLTSGNFSSFHKVRQDEGWYFHFGSPIDLHVIEPDGQHTEIQVGNDLLQGQQPQYIVPGGAWFAAKVANGGEFSLVSCTVAPGFDFEDFELADTALAELFPAHAELIRQFLHP